MELRPTILVAIFLASLFAGVAPTATGQLPPIPETDETKLAACAGQPDSCLIGKFFTNLQQQHGWTHTSFLPPPETTLGGVNDDGYLLAIEGSQLVGYLNIEGPRSSSARIPETWAGITGRFL